MDKRQRLILKCANKYRAAVLRYEALVDGQADGRNREREIINAEIHMDVTRGALAGAAANEDAE